MKDSKDSLFGRFARYTSYHAGRPGTFGSALLLVILWACSGPLFGFTDTWQLVINTGTTIITFLMVFLIQNSQNRDSEAIQIKLDELIRVQKSANNELMDLEDRNEQELDQTRKEFVQLAENQRKKNGGPAA